MTLRPRQVFGSHYWFCGGRRTRTADLGGMNPTSYHLLHPAIFAIFNSKFHPFPIPLQKECKTLTLFFIICKNYKKFALFSNPKWVVSITFNYE